MRTLVKKPEKTRGRSSGRVISESYKSVHTDAVFKEVMHDAVRVAPKSAMREQKARQSTKTYYMTPDTCWMMATSGEAAISEAASRRQSSGTRVSESIIRMLRENRCQDARSERRCLDALTSRRCG